MSISSVLDITHHLDNQIAYSDIDEIDEDDEKVFDYWSHELSYLGKDEEEIRLDEEKNEKEKEEMNEEVMDEGD